MGSPLTKKVIDKLSGDAKGEIVAEFVVLI